MLSASPIVGLLSPLLLWRGGAFFVLRVGVLVVRPLPLVGGAASDMLSTMTRSGTIYIAAQLLSVHSPDRV